MVDEIYLEKCNFWNFISPVTLTSTLDRVIWHTVMHHSLTSIYTPNFIEIGKTFCGRMFIRTHWLMDIISPSNVIRSTQRSRPKHSPSHLSWSSSNLHQLLPSTTIHSILPVQFTCLTIFLHNLSPNPLWSTSWSGALHLILDTFLYPVSVFFLPIPSQPVLQ